MRIWFFGTPHLSAQVLQDFLDTPDMEVVFVVTGEDKAVGRHQIITPNEVKTLALAHDIRVLQPSKIRGNTEFFDAIRSYDADYFVVVAYGKILPREVLDTPKKRCLNIHGSILPKYRGASPIQAALLNGETETGVTIMVMDEAMDEGDIVDILPIPIVQTETSGTLFEKFGAVSGTFAINTIRNLESGSKKPTPQDHSLATYCTKIRKEDGKLDFSKSAEELYHQWQAFTPWPGVFMEYEGKRLGIEQCSPLPLGEGLGVRAGTIIRLPDKTVGIVCTKWVLTLEAVKLEWKKSQTILEFVNGHQSFVSSVL